MCKIHTRQNSSLASLVRSFHSLNSAQHTNIRTRVNTPLASQMSAVQVPSSTSVDHKDLSTKLLGAFLCVDGKIRKLSDMKRKAITLVQPVIVHMPMQGLYYVLHRFDPVDAKSDGEFQIMVFRDQCPGLAWGGVFPQNGHYEQIAKLIVKCAIEFKMAADFTTLTIEAEAKIDKAGRVVTEVLKMNRAPEAYASAQAIGAAAALKTRKSSFDSAHVADVDTDGSEHEALRITALAKWRAKRHERDEDTFDDADDAADVSNVPPGVFLALMQALAARSQKRNKLASSVAAQRHCR